MFTRALTCIHHRVFHSTSRPGFFPESSSLVLQDGVRKQGELWEESSDCLVWVQQILSVWGQHSGTRGGTDGFTSGKAPSAVSARLWRHGRCQQCSVWCSSWGSPRVGTVEGAATGSSMLVWANIRKKEQSFDVCFDGVLESTRASGEMRWQRAMTAASDYCYMED